MSGGMGGLHNKNNNNKNHRAVLHCRTTIRSCTTMSFFVPDTVCPDTRQLYIGMCPSEVTRSPSIIIFSLSNNISCIVVKNAYIIWNCMLYYNKYYLRNNINKQTNEYILLWKNKIINRVVLFYRTKFKCSTRSLLVEYNIIYNYMVFTYGLRFVYNVWLYTHVKKFISYNNNTV